MATPQQGNRNASTRGFASVDPERQREGPPDGARTKTDQRTVHGLKDAGRGQSPPAPHGPAARNDPARKAA